MARLGFPLLLLLCAQPLVATDNHSYKVHEYATVSGGRSPDGRWSIASHGDGEMGYENFDLYLMREPAHEKPAPLRTGGSLDTAPLSIIAVWAPDSKHVALLNRSDRHVLGVRLFTVANGKVQPIKVPLLLDIVGRHYLRQRVHYDLFSRLYRVIWQQADRFTLQECDTFDAAAPIFESGSRAIRDLGPTGPGAHLYEFLRAGHLRDWRKR